ncbi:MAG: aminoacyl-histidine dipeptidase [Spirochaetales bacterium]|nr:aminoacyl-histidine dipeptidase [Spirochaetales bacterium]
MSIVDGFEPAVFWKHFYNLTRIPRGSGNEAGVRKYASDFAEKHGFNYKVDKIGNIIIKKPAAPGKESSPSVVLQGHMDMVCEKNRNKVHDFLKDPISLVVEDGWLKADGTTLGADNGVAIAFGLGVLESQEELGPVELLLTVDEETGLTGAFELDPKIVDSRILINLDSEEDGVIYVGCAGGINTEGYIPVEFETAPNNFNEFNIELTGLKGGHSGGEIHLGLGNALTLGSRFLWNASEKFETKLSFIEGGGKHNAIPREFFASIYVDEKDTEAFAKYAESYKEIISEEFKLLEPNLSFTISPVKDKSKEVFSTETAKRILNLMYSIPHGVIKLSGVLEGLVETSTNFARAELLKEGKGVEGSNTTGKTEFFVQTCQRSSSETELHDIADRIRACIDAAGGRFEFKHEYPGWDPNPNSKILEKTKKVYSDLFGTQAEIKAIHAGLECGVIGKKFDSMDMISFGPELSNVHTPGEKIQISTVKKAWNLLFEILKAV